MDAIASVKQSLLTWALDNAVAMVRDEAAEGGDGGANPYLAKYVHLLNLRALFEFCIRLWVHS